MLQMTNSLNLKQNGEAASGWAGALAMLPWEQMRQDPDKRSAISFGHKGTFEGHSRQSK